MSLYLDLYLVYYIRGAAPKAFLSLRIMASEASRLCTAFWPVLGQGCGLRGEFCSASKPKAPGPKGPGPLACEAEQIYSFEKLFMLTKLKGYLNRSHKNAFMLTIPLFSVVCTFHVSLIFVVLIGFQQIAF